MIYLDTETCGLHGMPVLLQYAKDDGPIVLYEIWRAPVGKTLDLLERLMQQPICGFNLAFDAFHIVKLYSLWSSLPKQWIPVHHINEIASRERAAVFGPTLKPQGVCDLLLHARKGKYQALMSRKPIRIRRVPTVLADALADELEERIEFDGILFAKAKSGARWKVYQHEDEPELSDVVLHFKPSMGLKFLAEYVMGKETIHFDEIEPPSYPDELGYAPYHDVTDNGWDKHIAAHIKHWAENEAARQYATEDIIHTRDLYEHLGRPEPGDDDSELAWCVACCRWRGYEIDIPGIKQLRAEAQAIVDASPINVNKPTEVRAYLSEVMDEMEQVVIADSTRAAILESISEWDTPAAERAKEIIAVRGAQKEVELYDKLLMAGRFHASFNVIGTLSSRMSGGDGMNAQAIKSEKKVRKMFPLAWEGFVLSGGDFESFEVAIAVAAYKDPRMHEIITSGKKIHAYFAMGMYPGHTYEEIMASAKTDNDMYTAGKSGFFGSLYFGDHNTLIRNFGIAEDAALRAFEGYREQFPVAYANRERIIKKFTSLSQPEGLGTRVMYQEPAEYSESLLGFKRYFTLENRVIRELFDLAQSPPKEWRIQGSISRRPGRVQTPGGAVASALYGAAFGVQGQVIRAGGNHEIQSTGAQITKRLQRRIWDLQPAGAGPLVVAPLQVHDEVMAVSTPELVEPMARIVAEVVEDYKPVVPLVAMDWSKGMGSWAEK